MLDKVYWKEAWDEYVRGNVVSKTAAKLIQRILLNTMTSTGKTMGDTQSMADATDSESELPQFKLTGMKFQESLHSTTKVDGPNEELLASPKAKARDSSSGPSKKKARIEEYEASHRIGERVWKTESCDIKAGDRSSPGNMFQESYKELMAALFVKDRTGRAHNAPFDEKRDGAASFNAPGYASSSMDTIIASFLKSSTKPILEGSLG